MRVEGWADHGSGGAVAAPEPLEDRRRDLRRLSEFDLGPPAGEEETIFKGRDENGSSSHFFAVEIFDACQRRGCRVLDPESHNPRTGFGVHGTGCAVCYGERGVEGRRRSKIAVEIFDACANLI